MFVITKAFKLATPGLGGNWQRDSRALCGKTERAENCVYKHIKSQRSGSNNKQGNLFEIHYTLHGKGGGRCGELGDDDATNSLCTKISRKVAFPPRSVTCGGGWHGIRRFAEKRVNRRKRQQ